MWNWLKEMGRKVGRRLGIIKSLNELRDDKRINIDEEQYERIEFNKRLYEGHVKEWHDLKYMGTIQQIERKQKSLNMPKVLSKKMARLAFNEGVNISIADDSPHAKQWELVSDIFTSNKFIRSFQRYLEYMFAMGGVGLEVYKDGDEAKLSYVNADAFIPLSRDNEDIDEAVVVHEFKEEHLYYTLLRWHEWVVDDEDEKVYRIKNELYVSKNENVIGDKVALNRIYPDLEEETLFYDLDHPLFIYMKPNEANNKDISSPLGISIFENAYDTLQMLDTMYDFWYNEFRLGKRRVAVPEYLVQTHYGVNGKPYVSFDDGEELFVAMNSGEMEEMQIKDLTVDIRSDQVIESIQSLLDVLSMQVGLSPGSFNFEQGGIKTATQVVSENSETYQTRSSHLSIIEDALRDLIIAVYEVATLDDNSQSEKLEREDISIDFNDGVFADKEAELKYWKDAVKDGLAPKRVALMRVHNLNEEEAQEWLDEMNAEGQQAITQRQQAVAQAELEIER